MVMPMAGLAPFSPIDQVTPLTYRDNDTYLAIQHKIRTQLDVLTAFANSIVIADNDNLNNGLRGLTDQFNAAINQLRTDLEALIAGSHDETIAYDPTNGSNLEGLSTVVGRVYDNLRVFAYFAKQYDDLQMTAAQYDGHNYTARHFDLGVTYPTLNDIQIG